MHRHGRRRQRPAHDGRGRPVGGLPRQTQGARAGHGGDQRRWAGPLAGSAALNPAPREPRTPTPATARRCPHRDHLHALAALLAAPAPSPGHHRFGGGGVHRRSPLANPRHANRPGTRTGLYPALARRRAHRDHAGPMARPIPRAAGGDSCVGRVVPDLQSGRTQCAPPGGRPPGVDHRHAIGPGRYRGQGAQAAPDALAHGGGRHAAQLAQALGVKAVPAFLVVDAQGQLRGASVGYTSEIGMRWRLWWARVF